MYNTLRDGIDQPHGLWEARDGAVIPIQSMTDGHLINSIRLLVREASGEVEFQKLSFRLDVEFEGRSEGVQVRHASLVRQAEICWAPKFQELCLDAERRGLDWKAGLPKNRKEAAEQQRQIDARRQARNARLHGRKAAYRGLCK